MQATQQTTTTGNLTEDNRRDELLWQMARRRAGFKYSLVAYFLVNTFLVGVWYFSSGPGSYFWPVWPLLGWGVGMIFQYFGAYHGDHLFSTQKEYEKLKNKQE